MRCISSNTVSATEGSGESYAVITVDPRPELAPSAFIMDLYSSAIGKSKALVNAVVQGGMVRVVLVDFAIARWGLAQNNQLPAFTAILPA